ncbi:GumN protein [Planctobacterium marinum]|uniref:GumN protein n=2 Tax=Planctobacterium marinum TaxID=1631968 RepID=A0AA48KQW1_9ALTE|nr:GumN protein [Planctobacterium marinum]
MHILTNEDYPLPNQFNEAFQKGQLITFETDIATVASIEFQRNFLNAMALSADEPRLMQQLTKETRQALEKKLASHAIPLTQFNNFKISMVLLNLALAEYRALGFTAPGVDATFHQKAVEQNKAIAALETPEEQINFLASMSDANAEQLVRYTLKDLENMPDYVSQLKSAWRTGNLPLFTEIGIKPFMDDYPHIYHIIIKARNDNWLAKIDEYIQTAEIESLFVGALHLAGPDGLVAQLKKQGYEVQQLE